MESLARRLLRTFGWHDDATVKGILLVGSAATGESDALSDLDLVVISEPVPSVDTRRRLYLDAGCDRAMIGFLRGDSPVLRSNVTAIDKVWVDGLHVDIAFCREGEVAVYDHEDFVILKPDASLERLSPIRPEQDVPVDELSARLSYSFRVLLVHRDRYARWCERRRWLYVDIGAFLGAARDMILVLNGLLLYNAASPHVWGVMERAPITVRGLSDTLTDIRQLDDRMASERKLRLMDVLIGDIERLCASRGVLLRPYDIGRAGEGEGVG